MKRFFYLQDNDRNVFMIFLVIAVVAVLLVTGVGGDGGNAVVARSDSVAGKSVCRQGVNAGRYAEGRFDAEGRRAELSVFDPNTADSTTLLRLGLSPRLVRNIYKYRAKGGVYARKEDFARMYGLTAGQYKTLEPYIRIADDYRPAAEVVVAESQNLTVRDTLRYPLKLKKGETVPLNTADTALLKRVPGVGSAYSRQIVAYRERLGGFYSAGQLLEISGFPKSALPYFSVEGQPCRRINVNNMTLNELRNHPYIGFYQAKTIIEHRRVHGKINGWEDLSMYRDFTPEVIARLRHYVVF